MPRLSKPTGTDPLERFLYWISERHQIHLKRQAGHPKPWTDDKVLQSFFFTNPYREEDKTTVWFREHVREPMRNSPEVIFATIAFRWFNYIPTGQILIENGLLRQWNERTAIDLLSEQRAMGNQLFTGAYMISSATGMPKLESVCRRISSVWSRPLVERAGTWRSLQQAHQDIVGYEGLGGFMAYEVVCDLRYTKWLDHACDKSRWCHLGPGAIRGLYRILKMPFTRSGNASSMPVPPLWQDEMVKLLKEVQRRLPKMPTFEMREIEHSLCEFDKYERALAGDGHLKRRYNGLPGKSSGLHPKQVKILRCLARASRPLTRNQIAKLSEVDPSKIGDYGGPRPLTQSEKTRAKWPFPALDSLGYLKCEIHDVDGRDIFLYTITQEGRKALEGS